MTRAERLDQLTRRMAAVFTHDPDRLELRTLIGQAVTRAGGDHVAIFDAAYELAHGRPYPRTLEQYIAYYAR